jgi:ABC-type cobalamin/Fe3+-siderophores transport system ATPase subunit
MKFFVRKYREPLPKRNNIFVLTSNSWDDYGTVCLFTLSFVDVEGDHREIGEVKILSCEDLAEKPLKVNPTTVLEGAFPMLGTTFISLGQSESYYENIHSLLSKDDGAELLNSLKDIAWDPKLAWPFEPTSAFRNALLRINEAQQARRFGGSLAVGLAIERSFSFTYSASIESAEMPTDVDIQFDPTDVLPGRAICIVGRNAVGKTQFLAGLARDLVQTRQVSDMRKQEMESRFGEGRRPLFTRVLAVSYSAFDKFSRPKSERSSYIYCGIRSERGQLSRPELVQRYRSNLARIRESKREREWQRHMGQVLGSIDEDLLDKLAVEVDDASISDDALSLLSSGQSILAHFVTALLAWLEPNSLVLFDEPETHLHPNAVASLVNALTSILDQYDSFAIIATHSPIVLQEIPRKRAIVFEREGNVTTAQPLALESFGESISELTRHVFETSEIPTLYRRVLRRLADSETIGETMSRFDEGLSMNAQAYLIAQHNR